MKTSLTRTKHDIPTLRSIEDLRGGVDMEKVINLSELYELGISNDYEEMFERMGIFHPSTVDGCKRRNVLAFLYTTPTDIPETRMKEIYEVGHLVHDLVQRRFESLSPALKKLGLNYEFTREVPYDPRTDQLFIELTIGGTSDGVLRIWNSAFEQRTTLEVKTQGHDQHVDMMKKERAWPKHVKQAHIYAYRNDTPLIHLFYVDKNNAKRAIWPYTFQQKLFDEAITYFAACADFARRGEVPPREETWLECKHCEYRTMCRPNVLAGDRRIPSVPKRLIRRK